VQIVQAVHAAGESSPGNLPEGTYAIVLSVPSQAKLLALERRLVEENVPHKGIREPDEPYCNELMAIGVEPTIRKKVKPFLKNLKLLR
jgi:hypothetical protein